MDRKNELTKKIDVQKYVDGGSGPFRFAVLPSEFVTFGRHLQAAGQLSIPTVTFPHDGRLL